MSRRRSLAPSEGERNAKRRGVASAAQSTAGRTQAVEHAGSSASLARWLPPIIMIVIAVIAFHNSFNGVFVLDDNPWIVKYAPIRQFWPPWGGEETVRPVWQLSLALNYAIGGLNPWGYHAVNLVIHIFAGLTLFGIVRRMLESEKLRARYGTASTALALAIAGIWLVHPLQTESVTYIVQRAESLMGLFYLLTLYCAIRAWQSPQAPAWSIAAIVACALGMGTKEIMVSAPIMVGLYDWIFVPAGAREAMRRRFALYAGLAATWLILLATLIRSRLVEHTFMLELASPWSYALTQSEVILHYLRLSIWPDVLVLDYGWPIAQSVLAVMPAIIVVLALLGATVFALVRRSWAGFWGAWFFAILAPTSSIVPIADVAFEHRMYLPLAAVIVLAVVGAHNLLAAASARTSVPASSRAALEAVLAAVVLSALVYATVQRNEDYRSELTMYGDNVAKRPENARAHNNLGVVLTRQDKDEAAVKEFMEAIRLKADYEAAHSNLGSALLKLGRSEEAVAHFSRAASMRPDTPPALYARGRALHLQGRLKEAMADYSRAVQLDPGLADARHDLGVAMKDSGDLNGAIAQLSEAVRLKPDDADARINLGLALMDAGRTKDAIAQYSSALRLKPDNAIAHNTLAAALVRDARPDEAVTHYREALRLKPDYADAENNWGAALFGQGQNAEAVAHFTRAVRLDPKHAEAHNNLGAALGSQGKLEEAADHFASAVALKPDFTDARDNLRVAQARLQRAKNKSP